MKIRPVGAELLHADRQIDITKKLVAFRNFGNAPKQKKICNWRTPLHRINLPNLKTFHKTLTTVTPHLHPSEKKNTTFPTPIFTKLPYAQQHYV